MKHLLNTLYVTSEDIYLSLEGENVLANRAGQVVARYPLHTLQGIVTFSYAGASAALMGACASRGIGLSFCTPQGKYLASVAGKNNGNVLLRREQYRIADNPTRSASVAGHMIFGKLYNGRWSIERTLRDHAMRVNTGALQSASAYLRLLADEIIKCQDPDRLRGIEGAAATAYFGIFDELVLHNKPFFHFGHRNRRPPLDPVNALLSFSYTLLTHDCAAALSSVGLDAYVGFLHRDRPGRASLALDLMEELRPCFADRFVLTMVNRRRLAESDFQQQGNGAVLLTDSARRLFLSAWQEKKRETITHPYLKEKMEWGMIPYVQALLLARYIRGDLDAYPPFLWK